VSSYSRVLYYGHQSCRGVYLTMRPLTFKTAASQSNSFLVGWSRKTEGRGRERDGVYDGGGGWRTGLVGRGGGGGVGV
jgi:hypothetical protein